MSDEQISLFDVDPDWKEHWKEMPEYEHKDLQPEFQLIVSFENYEDLQAFAKLVDQKITKKTPSIWYPELKWEKVIGLKQYADENRDVFDHPMEPVLNPGDKFTIEGFENKPGELQVFTASEPTREEMAASAGKAYGEAQNDQIEKDISEKMFPTNPEEADSFAMSMKESRGELMAKQGRISEEDGEKLDKEMVDLHINQAGELPEMPEELMNVCPVCDAAGFIMGDSDMMCTNCNRAGVI